jgi:hypothetical protein
MNPNQAAAEMHPVAKLRLDNSMTNDLIGMVVKTR